MPQLIQNGDVLTGTSNDSANILYSEPDGSSKNVQDKIEELNNSLKTVYASSGTSSIPQNTDTKLTAKSGLDNGLYLINFSFSFTANTEGQITIGSVSQSGHAETVNNYISITSFYRVTDGNIYVTLWSTSVQTNRPWIMRAIRLSD